MTILDIVVGALTAWRENRGGGRIGMQSVINTIVNESKRRNCGVYAICTFPLRYSSISAKGDPQLSKWPETAEELASFDVALQLMDQAAQGKLLDITNGATNYYATSMIAPPYWASVMQYTTTIAGQKFYKPASAA